MNVTLAYVRADFDRQCTFQGTGFIVTAGETQKVRSGSVSSRKYAARAPDDTVLVRLFFNGRQCPEILSGTEASRLALARAEVTEILGVNKAPVMTRVFCWNGANPQYDVGHLDRVKRIETLVQTIPGLVLTGCSYRGVGLADCIVNARKTVEKLRDVLT